MNEVDLRDGKLDGKIVKTQLQECRGCGKRVAKQRANCYWCGGDLVVKSPFSPN